METLNSKFYELLLDVLNKYQPSMLNYVRSPSEILLSDEQRKIVCNLISDELLETGLKENLEPNPRGLLLEDLLDLVNPVHDEFKEI